MTSLFSPTRRAGNLLFLSGQCGFDEDGALVPGGLAAETRRTLDNIADTLRSENLGLADLVSVTCYVTDISSRAEMDRAYVRAFDGIPLPTRTTIEVAALPAGLSVEMTAVAFVDNGGAALSPPSQAEIGAVS
ncbi:RidA family protein [Mycobacterium sp. 21AC1]|uniref:RidA family protein n=1 Tax=[Mycobacterium] appelbergii TaxID=2939269 RepID=UPI002938D939|nr:RidA family protein [Mycobacterium sp. 21AC1]MDV3127313.1 RidA family protein [Mycobacterium sp. 21AC1]